MDLKREKQTVGKVKDRRARGIAAREPREITSEDRDSRGRAYAGTMSNILQRMKGDENAAMERRDPMPALRKHASAMLPGTPILGKPLKVERTEQSIISGLPDQAPYQRRKDQQRVARSGKGDRGN